MADGECTVVYSSHDTGWKACFEDDDYDDDDDDDEGVQTRCEPVQSSPPPPPTLPTPPPPHPPSPPRPLDITNLFSMTDK
ncbi:hypothetical protein M0804_002973 [Polistes exclamans]|nr:hypothetical protein M0804_002973 [Polistes exclamans]